MHSKEALHSILAVQKPPLKVMEIPSDGDLEMKGKCGTRADVAFFGIYFCISCELSIYRRIET